MKWILLLMVSTVAAAQSRIISREDVELTASFAVAKRVCKAHPEATIWLSLASGWEPFECSNPSLVHLMDTQKFDLIDSYVRLQHGLSEIRESKEGK